MGISQDPAGLQEGLGEYGNFTQRGVEDAAPYKTCAFDDSTRKFAQLPKALTERRYRRNRCVPF